jgi:ABC-type transport system substrate-binding protein
MVIGGSDDSDGNAIVTVQRAGRIPLGQALGLIALIAVALTYVAMMSPTSPPNGPSVEAGAAATAAATANPKSPTPTDPLEPKDTGAGAGELDVSGPIIHGLVFTDEEMEDWQELSAGDVPCPNGEECGEGEVSTPLP